jgi:hypothetical protein
MLREIKDACYVIESYKLNNEKKIHYNYNCGDIEEIKANIKMFMLNNPSYIAKVQRIYPFSYPLSGDAIKKMRKLEGLCEKLNSGEISPKQLPKTIR